MIIYERMYFNAWYFDLAAKQPSGLLAECYQ